MSPASLRVPVLAATLAAPLLLTGLLTSEVARAARAAPASGRAPAPGYRVAVISAPGSPRLAAALPARSSGRGAPPAFLCLGLGLAASHAGHGRPFAVSALTHAGHGGLATPAATARCGR